MLFRSSLSWTNLTGLPAVLQSGSAFMCLVGMSLKGGGGILWFESFGIEAKIASFAKLAYTTFNIEKIGVETLN